jgi:hypothetical protein
MNQELIDTLKKLAVLITKQTAAIEGLTLTLKENKKALALGVGPSPLAVDLRFEKPHPLAKVPFSRADDQPKIESIDSGRMREILGTLK